MLYTADKRTDISMKPASGASSNNGSQDRADDSANVAHNTSNANAGSPDARAPPHTHETSLYNAQRHMSDRAMVVAKAVIVGNQAPTEDFVAYLAPRRDDMVNALDDMSHHILSTLAERRKRSGAKYHTVDSVSAYWKPINHSLVDGWIKYNTDEEIRVMYLQGLKDVDAVNHPATDGE